MNKFRAKVRRTTRKAVTKVNKYSPEIMIVTGIVGLISSAVMACKKSMEMPELMEASQECIDDETARYEAAVENGVESEYPLEEYKHEIALIKRDTAIEVVKMYAPSVILATASVFSILAGNHILRKRYAVVSTSYAALDSAFRAYRERVKEKLGEEAEKDIRYGVTENVEITTDEKGKQHKSTKLGINNGEYSPYAVFFDSASRDWEPDAEYNKSFLLGQQKWWNEELKRKGVIFLNDIKKSLDLPITSAGQMVGWIYEDDDEYGSDSYIDFGIFDPRERNIAFVNGYEDVILLDFNCVPILDKI